jgi:hypothetical protein
VTALWQAVKALLPFLASVLKNDPRVRKALVGAVGLFALLGAFLAGRESKEDEWDAAIAREQIERLENQLRIERAAANVSAILQHNLDVLTAEMNEQVMDYEIAFPAGSAPGRAATADDVRRLCKIRPC